MAKKENEVSPFETTWMDVEGIMLNEKSDRETQTPCNFTYMRTLKNKINEQTKQRRTHRYRE